MDDVDRRIVDTLQSGFPIGPRPFAEAARWIGSGEAELIARIHELRAARVLSRFGPMFNAERLGGALTLCAMAVPEASFDEIAAKVNAHPEVAHNYAREHELNLWFVLATEEPERVRRVIAEIETETGLEVVDLPKQREYFVGLRLPLGAAR